MISEGRMGDESMINEGWRDIDSMKVRGIGRE